MSAPLATGLHDGITPARYHADPCESPSLSSGVARTLAEKTPAHARLEHPRLAGQRRDQTEDMDFGGLVHALLSGLPSEMFAFEVSPFDEFRTKEARAWRDAVIAAGKTPVKRAVLDAAELCAGAMRNAINRRDDSLNPFEAGRPEVTAIWRDEGDAWCRARYDRLVVDPNGFCDLWDFKTTASVTPEAITRTIVDHGYHVQAAFYLRGARDLLPQMAGRFSFLLAFIEQDPPHTVRVVPMLESWLGIGDRICGRAIRLWGECLSRNEWPSYTGANLTIEPPEWYVRRFEELST